MGRSQTKVSERRGTRNSKNSDEAVKPSPTVKGTKSIGKNKEETVENKKKEVNDTDTERMSKKRHVKNHDKKSDADEKASNTKPTTSKSSPRVRSSKKRSMSIIDIDDPDNVVDDMSVESSNDNQSEEYDKGEESKKIDKEIAKKKRMPQTQQKAKQVGPARPCKTSKIIKQFTMCTYCGKNLSEHLKPGDKVNLKRHFALKHAAALCAEMGSGEGPVCCKAFMKHLDCVDQVYRSLKSHGYQIIPACNYFDVLGPKWKISEVAESGRDYHFQSFVSEGSSVFNRYQILYLKGISVPRSFCDLFKEDDTNYDNIKWVSEKPSANNFSLKPYKLSEEEIIGHTEEVKNKLTCAVTEWSDHYKELYEHE